MRDCRRRKTILVTLVASLLLGSAVSRGALPPDPDNAALLYYQGFLVLAKSGEEAQDRIAAVARGAIPPDDTVRADIQACQSAIESAEAAAQVRACDWGLRFSQGYDLLMPHLAQVRFLTFVLVADARVRAADGDYPGALERCLMTGTLARHVGDDTMVSYLVSIAVRELGHKCMDDVIGLAAHDAEVLEWFKREFATSLAGDVSLIRPLRLEVKVMTDLMQMDKCDELVDAMTSPDQADAQEVADFVATLDTGTLERAREIYAGRIASMLTVMSTPMPFAEGHAQMERLAGGFNPNDAASRVAEAFMPALGRVYTLKTRGEAHANAIKVAIEVCLQRAKSGQWPDVLPQGMPKDPFSGEDFEYERTDSGFVLRCQGKEPEKDVANEYTFAVK